MPNAMNASSRQTMQPQLAMVRLTTPSRRPLASRLLPKRPARHLQARRALPRVLPLRLESAREPKPQLLVHQLKSPSLLLLLERKRATTMAPQATTKPKSRRKTKKLLSLMIMQTTPMPTSRLARPTLTLRLRLEL